jgi:hypothetical protein
MSDRRIDELLAQGTDPSTLAADGSLTAPRSWGVYELHMTRGASVRRFRIGNYPVRGLELEREFGLVRTIGVFTSRTTAEELQRLLNERGRR